MSFRPSPDDRFDLQWLRSAVDLLACFIMAVILLRGFVLEGYLISTGSMAPGLLGFHKHVVCPSCQFQFAFGVTFDDSVDPALLTASTSDGTRRYATCPNCGQVNIDVSEVPTSHGDQLLVQKHVYDFRRPQRWETVVFRNPASPGEAYVKRVTGLPGEELQVLDGDIYVNGALARKDYRTQRDMRIAVCDLQHLADSVSWEMPWQVEEGWQLQDRHLQSSADAAGNRISFRPWRWYGGTHFVETPLSPEDAEVDWQQFLDRFDRLPVSWVSRIEYDRERSVLRCEGVMPQEMQADLMAQATSDAFRNAVYRLAALSHLAAVTDHYGYNSMVSSPEYSVSDLMLRTEISWQDVPEELAVTVPVEADVLTVRLLPRERRVQLEATDRNLVLQSGSFEADPVNSDAAVSADATAMELEVSNIDHQVVVAINGQPCFPAFVLPVSPTESPAAAATPAVAAGVAAADSPAIPAAGLVASRGLVPDSAANAARAARSAVLRERQGRWSLFVRGGGVRLQELQMFRDVYYTPGRRRNAVERPYRIAADSYFVQGDNSPVSSDSRNWPDPCVPHRLLLGKPFLLHLPSRPAVLELGARRWPIRIPDWSRIRYIH